MVAKSGAGNEATLHEGDMISVSGYIYRARCQKDGDYHLEIGTQKNRTNAKCIIVEVPDPSEVHVAALRAKATAARNTLLAMDASVFAKHAKKAPVPVAITGQFFLDAPHYRKSDPSGGRGTVLESGRHCASNLWEIHPVTALR